jgi:hypothetical protein
MIASGDPSIKRRQISIPEEIVAELAAGHILSLYIQDDALVVEESSRAAGLEDGEG